MTETLLPEKAEHVLDAVCWAAENEKRLEVRGGGSKRGLGRPAEADAVLDLSRLSGIGLYQPEELVISAHAGTPLAEIEDALSRHGQQLAFEPADWGRLLGGASGGPAGSNVAGTIGGVIACNLSGPRRIKAGAARDHILGFHAVSGRGETFKSGGRVVKNVTGFDLSKLLTGSYGTLAVMTDITLKVLPAPEETRTVLVLGLEDADAVRAMTAALHSAYEISGAAHLPKAVAAASAIGAVSGAGQAVTALRVEGPGPSVTFRVKALDDLLSPFGPVDRLEGTDSAALWREIGGAAYFAAEPERQVWRLSVPPADGARVAAEILNSVPGRAFFDWAGGLVWLGLEPGADAGDEIVRRSIEPGGGHATLIRASQEVRTRVPVFQPQAAPLAALTARVKEAFDPKGILNPGRMYEGV